jgi:hypothetical protein
MYLSEFAPLCFKWFKSQNGTLMAIAITDLRR